MQIKSLSAVLFALVALLVSPFALAHTGVAGPSGFAAGLMHPVTGLDHLLVAIAAGFWAGRKSAHGMPDAVYFLSLLLVGMLLGAICLAFPQLQLLTLLVVMLTTTVIAASIIAPQYFARIFFGGFAIYHGIVHLLEMSVLVTATAYIVGLLVSTGLLLMTGIFLRQRTVAQTLHREARY